MTDKKVITGSASITLGAATVHATGTVTQAIDKIEASNDIPIDAKNAIKDFIQEKFVELQEFTSDLIDFPIPDEIAEWWPIVVDILLKIFN